MKASPSAVAAGLVDHARLTPHRLAVKDDRRSLTFEELDGCAGTLARRLLERLTDVGSTTAVPVVAGRDLESVVATHGLVRAGIPFAPIDAELPRAAVADLLARLGGPELAVVARPDLAGLLPAEVEALGVPLVVDDPAPPQPVGRHDVAEVVFTSGSTGRPKGVVLEWEYLEGTQQNQRFFTAPGSHAGIVSSIGANAGAAQSLVLAYGVSIVVIDPTRLDPVALLDRFDEEQLTEVRLVPSLLAQIAGRWPAGRVLESVTRVATFGEALEWHHVGALRDLVTERAIVHAIYGATEMNVRLHLKVEAGDPLGVGRVPLGVPLDPEGVGLLPVGGDPNGPTEIIAKGIVARGYLGEPELTAARFWVDDDGVRCWRSGDLAELGPDGVYHLKGRVDDLVKIRGKLAEPAEPERVLLQIAGVRGAVVLPHTNERGATRLVAHLELHDGSSLTPGQIRRRVAAELAPHLVPSPLVRHERLPTLPAGKIDRARLRQDPLVPWRSATPRGPSDPLERSVVVACQEILELDQVALDDDLWELGLDSLAAVELTAACSELGFGPLEPDAPLEHPTPAALVALLRRGARRGHAVRASTGVVLNPGGSRPPIVACPGAGGNAVAYHWLARALGDDQPVLVIEPRGLNTTGRPDRTYTALITRAAATVRTHHPDGPVTIAGHSVGGLLAFEVARELNAEGRAVHLVLLDTRARGETGDAGATPAPLPLPLRTRVTNRPPAALLRRVAARAHTRLLSLHPGRPRPLAARHRSFVRIAGRAWRGYVPESASFPATLLYVAGSDAPGTWATILPQLETREIPGTHLSALQPPHVNHLAVEFAAIHAKHLDVGDAGATIRR